MIPDYQTLMLPVLKASKDEAVQTQAVVASLAVEFGLTADERDHLLPSGKQRTFDNRINWAKSYLKQAGLLTYPRRGFFLITEDGRKVLSRNPERIDAEYLMEFEAFRAFRSRRHAEEDEPAASDDATTRSDTTPDETLRLAHRQIDAALGADLLERVRAATPKFFEDLIVSLLLAMGYGGAAQDTTRALGRSGDNGVDGVVDQDPLGVDQIYVQAKRYALGNNISAGEIRDFFGALNLKKAQKGIFFTTSSFSPSAVQTAKNLSTRIVLIDGEQLSNLMVKYGVGCRTEEVLHLKKIDDDFFEEA
ncbi:MULTISPECIES: restriction endonuclease [unclassified Bradyrhizobium]|uniref:restriction endonuclease n=1 Tax=unclassified Bradyrhizobium TaxID=2631580 RepID=UPI0028ECD8A4|nr:MULTISPECIES: restriction endonuclease [unclassified Bradyrhizobium]